MNIFNLILYRRPNEAIQVRRLPHSATTDTRTRWWLTRLCVLPPLICAYSRQGACTCSFPAGPENNADVCLVSLCASLRAWLHLGLACVWLVWIVAFVFNFGWIGVDSVSLGYALTWIMSQRILIHLRGMCPLLLLPSPPSFPAPIC